MTVTTALVGRQRQLTALRERIERAAVGAGGAMLVTAEAGLGKSRLVHEVATEAAARGFTVLEGGCVAVGGEPLRHVALFELLRAAEAAGRSGRPASPAGESGAVPPSPAVGPPSSSAGGAGAPASLAGASTEELLERILAVVDRASPAAPLLVVVEDVHWADRGTCEVLMVLARRVSGRPVALIVTCRDDELPRGHHIRLFLSELERAQLVTVVPAPPLSPADTAALIEHLVGYVEPAVAATVYERSDGNPLLVEELCAAGPGSEGVRGRLVDVLLARADRLSAAAQAVARAVAAGGPAVDEDALDQVVEGTGDVGDGIGRGADGLREALDHHLLVRDTASGTVRFRHILVAEAVYAQLLRRERATLHARWAEVLSGRGDDPAVVAHHWTEAGHHERALAASVAAARTAVQALAAHDALRHHRNALRLWGQVDDPARVAGLPHVELCLRAAEAANWAGEPEVAVEAVDLALAPGAEPLDPMVRSVLLERKGWYLLRQGRNAPARTAYAAAVEGMPPDAPPAVQARVLAGSVRIWEREHDHARALSTGEAAVELAVRAGSVAEEGQARYMLGRALLAVGDDEGALAELALAAAAAERAGEAVSLTMALLDRADTLAASGRLEEAQAEIEATAARLRAAGRRDPDALLAAGVEGSVLYRLGRLDAARQVAETIVGEARSPVTLALGHLLSGLCRLDAAALGEAREHLELARFLAAPLLDGRVSGNLALGRAELAVAEGRLQAAEEAVTEGIARVERTGDDEVLAHLCLLGLRIATDRALAVAGRQPTRATARADAAIDRYHHLLAGLVAPGPRGVGPVRAAVAATWAAERARLDGGADPAAWAEAAARWAAVQWPRRAVLATVRRAEALLATGARDDAGAVLEQAVTAAGAIGSRLLAARAADVARRAGLVVGTAPAATEHGPGRPGPAAVGALTRREREVLRLVAAGATNRQIGAALYISAKTASVHVSRILTKLGVATRDEAVAAVRRADPSALA